MQNPRLAADAFLDATGEACSTITLVIRQTLLALEAGQVLEVLTHDPATRAGVPAWCRLTGHELAHVQADGAADTRFFIRRTTHRT